MTHQANTSMVFFASFRTSIAKLDLPAETKLNYYEAVLDYGLFGTTPHFDNPVLDALFDVMMPIIDANTRRKQHSLTCSENGKKGGAPKGNTNASKSKEKTTKTTQKTSQKTSINVNDNDNVKVNGNVKDNDKIEKETKDISFISSSSSSKEKKEKAKKEIFLSDNDSNEVAHEQDMPITHTDSQPSKTTATEKPSVPAKPTEATNPSAQARPSAPTQPKQSAAPPTATLSIDDRNKIFYNSLVPYVDKYGTDAIQSFYDFWIEEDATKKFMKFELERTWNLEYRLERWLAKRQRLNLP